LILEDLVSNTAPHAVRECPHCDQPVRRPADYVLLLACLAAAKEKAGYRPSAIRELLHDAVLRDEPPDAAA
jgi:hypothetical protein